MWSALIHATVDFMITVGWSYRDIVLSFTTDTVSGSAVVDNGVLLLL